MQGLSAGKKGWRPIRPPPPAPTRTITLVAVSGRASGVKLAYDTAAHDATAATSNTPRDGRGNNTSSVNRTGRILFARSIF